MPDEFDAFGRKKDDAGLGDLGWGTTAETPAPPVATTTVTPAPSPTRRRPSPIPWLIALAVLGGVCLVVFSVGRQSNDGARTTLDGFETLTTSAGGTPADQGDGAVPEQVRSASFFAPKGLRAGLKILASEQPGRISNYSMRKDRIDVQVIRGHKTHIVELQQGAEVPRELSSATAVSSSDTISYEELNATAPERLMKAANARLNTSPKQVDYFVAQKFTGALQWGIYYKNGKVALGDSRGRFSRRLQ